MRPTLAGAGSQSAQPGMGRWLAPTEFIARVRPTTQLLGLVHVHCTTPRPSQVSTRGFGVAISDPCVLHVLLLMRAPCRT